MARTKPIRRSYGAGEWGRNRVRVFPDPKTGLLQIEWRENGRRLSKSLKHRDWSTGEEAGGRVRRRLRSGRRSGAEAEAEPEPPTLETLFDIYGEEVTPTKGRQSRRHDRAAMRMFLGFLRTGPQPGNAVAARLGQVHQGTTGGAGRPERKARIGSNNRTGPEATAGDPQLGREVEGRAWPPLA